MQDKDFYKIWKKCRIGWVQTVYVCMYVCHTFCSKLCSKTVSACTNYVWCVDVSVSMGGAVGGEVRVHSPLGSSSVTCRSCNTLLLGCLRILRSCLWTRHRTSVGLEDPLVRKSRIQSSDPPDPSACQPVCWELWSSSPDERGSCVLPGRPLFWLFLLSCFSMLHINR